MPYNNTAIPPPEQITGSAALPLARVKKILQVDEDINQCSNNAAFVITYATEMFVRCFAEQGHNVVKAETKPRHNIQYKDLANAVARIDNLEFLTDIVPRTMTYREFKEKKAVKGSSKSIRPLQPGQTTLDGKRSGSSHIVDHISSSDVMQDDRTISPEESLQRPDTAYSSNGATHGNGNIVFEHYEPNGNPRHEEPEDIEMI